MSDNIDKELVEQIKKAREKKGLTQDEVAKKSGMTTTYFAMIERGEVNPSIAKINKILDVVGLQLVLKKK